MKTEIFRTDSAALMNAAAVIQKGGLVAFPTETVYGLGANGLDAQAVSNIFKVKGRPNDNPLILHISHINQIKRLTTELPYQLDKLTAFMPGPLTIVVKRSTLIPDVVTAGLETVAIRIPVQPIAREFISLCGVPVAAPSANLSGKPSPTTAEHVISDLYGRVDGIIEGPNCSVGLESTVLDLSCEVPTILRPGGVTLEQLESVLGHIEVGGSGDKPKAPGMKYRHYAPRAPLIITRGGLAEEIKQHNGKIGVLTVHEDVALDAPHVVFSLGNTPEDYAANLFARLRAFDDEHVDIIISEDIVGGGICEAVRNRLYKAAQYIKG